MLSQRALNLLDQLFNEQSNLQLPVGVAAEVVEIRQFIKEGLPKPQADNLVKFPTSPRRGRPPQQPPSQES